MCLCKKCSKCLVFCDRPVQHEIMFWGHVSPRLSWGVTAVIKSLLLYLSHWVSNSDISLWCCQPYLGSFTFTEQNWPFVYLGKNVATQYCYRLLLWWHEWIFVMWLAEVFTHAYVPTTYIKRQHFLLNGSSLI